MTVSGTESVINKVQYVEQDFSSFVDSSQSFLQTNYPEDFSDYVNSQMGQALIDQLAYSMHNLAWYMNRRVTDLYFPTAISPNAVAKIARMLGYKPSGAIPTIATITMTLNNGPFDFPIRITKGFQFKGPQDLIFEYQGDVDIVYQPGETSKTFEVKEGRTIVANYVSDGSANQIYKLLNVPANKYVAAGLTEVSVNGIPWTEYDFIPYEIVQAFEVDILSRPPSLKFGDSVQGVIPTTNHGITIKYFVTTGFRGKIASTGIQELVAPLVVNSTPVQVTITQPDPSVGGEDPETLSEIVVNAPRFQSTQDRAITKIDYDYLSNQYPNVAKADAQIIRTVSADYTVMSIFDLMNADLEQINHYVRLLSGYGLVSAYTTEIRNEISSISGTIDLSKVEVDSSYLTGASGYGTLSQIDSQMIDLINLTSGAPSVSGQMLAIAQSVTGYTNTVSGYMTTIRSDQESVSGYLYDIQSDMDLVLSQCATIDSIASDVQLTYVVTGYTESISGDIQDLYEYLDDILSDGCRANTVQVSVLSKDANRRYVAPPQSVMDGLKLYLEERKDAVHTVVVVPGTALVVDADVRIEVKLSKFANEADVINRLQDAMTKSDEEPFGLLVEREYNLSLYLVDVYTYLKSVVEDFEVDYLNVVIQGPTEYLDGRGNLVIPKGYVIQAGTVTVTKLYT